MDTKTLVDNIAQAKQNRRMLSQEKEMQKHLHIITDVETYEKYKAVCQSKKLSMNEVTNILIYSYLNSED